MRKRESELLRDTFEANLGMNLVMVDAARSLPGPPRRRRGSRAEAPHHRRRVHPRLRGGGGQARPHRLPDPGHALPRRHRIDRPGDQGGPEDQDPPQRRRPARPTCASSSSSRCATSSRTRCARSAWSWACPSRWSSASPSRDRAWPSASSARSPAERLDTLREADWIVIDEIKAAGLYRNVWQSFAILTPVRSVGVMGDGRTYANVVAIRAVTSEDGMTADWAKLPVRRAGPDQRPHRQRGARRQPRRLRHQQQAAGHHRVGVTGAAPAASAGVCPP